MMGWVVVVLVLLSVSLFALVWISETKRQHERHEFQAWRDEMLRFRWQFRNPDSVHRRRVEDYDTN